MAAFHFPWLSCGVAINLIGALFTAAQYRPERARKIALLFVALTVACTIAQWFDFKTLIVHQAGDGWKWLPVGILEVDAFSSPLLPMIAIVFGLTTMATMKTKVRRFSFSSLLVAQAIVLATLCSTNGWIIIGLLIAAESLLLLEYRSRGKSMRGFVFHLLLTTLCLVAGWTLITMAAIGESRHTTGLALLWLGILIRMGFFPFHFWVTDLFDSTTFGTALLMSTPLIGAYAAIRLLFPLSTDWMLNATMTWGVLSAVYFSGMALVQLDTRRFFCFIFLSQAALVMVGASLATPMGLTSSLCMWTTVALAMTGLGLTLRSLESRLGRISLNRYFGMYEHTPTLAILFLITGLASVGFPGTIGFVSFELLIDGTVQTYPVMSAFIVLVATLNGIAILKVYFRLFTGVKHHTTINLRSRIAERISTVTLATLILFVGLFPQAWIESRYEAAKDLLSGFATNRTEIVHEAMETQFLGETN